MVPHGLLLLQKKNVQHERFRFQRKHPEPDRPDTTVGIAAKRPMSPTPEERTPLKALFGMPGSSLSSQGILIGTPAP